ncbi:hypothetical protein GCM10010455_22140 [Microbacterium esteraromaticum]
MVVDVNLGVRNPHGEGDAGDAELAVVGGHACSVRSAARALAITEVTTVASRALAPGQSKTLAM